jgi:formiminotetrahydrofolate cyclodeaminase
VTLSSLGIDEFARRLSSSEPTPGGGSAAAASATMAASLVSMVATLTARSSKFADVAQRVSAIADRAAKLRDELLACIDGDAAAFDRVSTAYRLPRDDDAQKRARSDAIQAALRGAAEPPMRVAEAACDVTRLAAELTDIGNRSALSDVACAALLAQAAAQGAAFNVAINVKDLKDRPSAQTALKSVASVLAQIDLLSEVILGKVNVAVGR